MIEKQVSFEHGKTVYLSFVACLGDSITKFSGYSLELQKLLGHKSKVFNFGVDGATVCLILCIVLGVVAGVIFGVRFGRSLE